METNEKRNKIKDYSIVSLIVIVLALLLAIIHNNISSKNLEPQIITVHDTTVVTKLEIKEKEKIKYITLYDTLYIYLTDSIRDTIRLQIPIDHKLYTDTFITDTTKTILDIKYSGYKASLDGVYVQTSFTQKEKVKVKHTGFGLFVGVGLHLGYGANINHIDKTFNPGPYIGVGITYGWGYHW